MKLPVNKSIFNKLLSIVIVIVAALVVVFCVILYMRNHTYDISVPYSSIENETQNFATADTLAQNLVVSDGNVALSGVELSSDSEKALLFNTESKTAMFAQGIYDKAYPASITKVMTALLAIEYGNMSDTVTMEDSDFALEEGSQNSGLQSGDVVTMEQLFKSLLVYSANDAAMAISRHISGSTEAFVELMNQKAQSLGMTQTHFENPHGLHNDNHYTCAYDIYLLMNEAMQHSEFVDTIRLSSYTLSVTHADGSTGSFRLDSTDKYITGEKQVPSGVNLWGGKTGTTDEAGSCLALIAQNEKGIPCIAIILNANNKTSLYDDFGKLLSQINNV